MEICKTVEFWWKGVDKDERDELEGSNGDIWDIDFYQNTVPNGVPLELLMVNEINIGI